MHHLSGKAQRARVEQIKPMSTLEIKVAVRLVRDQRAYKPL